MNRDTFQRHHKTLCDDALSLAMRKNADYATQGMADADVFANLRMCETAGLCSAPTGILVRLTDKLARLGKLIGKKGYEAQVKDESIRDSIKDGINYLVLLDAMLTERGMCDQHGRKRTEDT